MKDGVQTRDNLDPTVVRGYKIEIVAGDIHFAK